MSHLHRLLGGSPIALLAKLLFLSLVIGAIMSGLGLTPATMLARAVAAARSLFGLGFDAVRDIGRYVLTGAVIVIPVWLIARLAGRAR